MRKLIISDGLGYDLSLSEQIYIAAEAGWNGMFTSWHLGDDLEANAKVMDLAGMKYQSVHAPFGKTHLLWESEVDGDQYADMQIECLRQSKNAGVELVVAHAIIGMERNTPTSLGLRRFERIFTAAENMRVTVALENTEGEVYLEALMKEFGSSPYVRFCIDTGHEMCYNQGRDIIGKYAHKLICTHLNDNMGQTGEAITWLDDSHLLPFDGVADWQGIANRLNAAGYSGDLTFELTSKNKPDRHTHDRYSHLDYKAFITLALERARRFREIIEQ